MILMRRMLDGDWTLGDDFLIVPPGAQVQMTYDESVIGCDGSG
jgi:hypothetical protein